jgi:copper chaperone
MSITLNVPSIVCDGCASTITKAIQNAQPTAQVQVDLTTKVVTVESDLPESTLKEAIAAVGHTVA